MPPHHNYSVNEHEDYTGKFLQSKTSYYYMFEYIHHFFTHWIIKHLVNYHTHTFTLCE